MTILQWVSLVAAILALAKSVVSDITNGKRVLAKIGEGELCLMRDRMAQIYYKHREERHIRQYEYESFMHLYEAYKALGGNSFADKIHEEVKEWEVVS